MPTSKAAFTEQAAWSRVAHGWHHLHGHFRDLGYSLEWHDFSLDRELDWAKSFHPGSVEICLNLEGDGEVDAGGPPLTLNPMTAGFYVFDGTPLKAKRSAAQEHRFITIELSRAFLLRHLSHGDDSLHPAISKFTEAAGRGSAISEPIRLNAEHQAMISSLRKPPVHAAAQRLWYHAKAIEIASALFYSTPSVQELFCERQKRVNQDRVQKVIAILKENLAETPSLEEIGKRVACSHFHLTRIFRQEVGRSMSQYLRQLRMERAAELLREGKLKITTIAMDVGYSSPSHFSTAFHETFGCCPGLYPMKTPSQKAADESNSV